MSCTVRDKRALIGHVSEGYQSIVGEVNRVRTITDSELRIEDLIPGSSISNSQFVILNSQ